jgi:hypothetical protein
VTIWEWIAVLAVFGLGLAQLVRAFRFEPSSEREPVAGRRIVNAALLFSLAVLLAGFLGGAA